MTCFRILMFYLAFLVVAGSSCNSGYNKPKDLSQDTTLSLITREWSKKINSNPKRDDYYYERALSLTKESRYPLALEDIRRALELKPNHIPYYLCEGDINFAAGKTKDALVSYEKAVKVNPKDEEALFRTARFQLFVKDYLRAEQNFRKLIRINNGRPDAFFYLGTVYKEMNDTAGAEREFLNSITVDPEYYNSYIQLGNIYADKTNPKGLDYFSNAIRVDEFSDEAYYGRGLLFQKLGKYTEAVKDYQKTITLNPTHKFAYYNTGNINALKGNYGLALEQFQTALKFAPDFDKAYNRIAQIMELQGDFSSARINYEKCLQINPNFGLAKEGLERLNKK